MRAFLPWMARGNRRRPAAPHRSWDTVCLPSTIKLVLIDDRGVPLDKTIFAGRQIDDQTFVLVAPAAARFNLEPLDRIVDRVGSAPANISILYGDDATIVNGDVARVDCKPMLNKALYEAVDYIGFPLFIRGSVFTECPFVVSKDMDGAWYGLLLEAMRRGIGFERIPETLICHFDERHESSRQRRLKIIQRSHKKTRPGYTAQPGKTAASIRLMARVRDWPDVTLVIPTRQSRPDAAETRTHIETLLDSLPRSTYPLDRLRVIIGDDVENDEIFATRRDPFPITRIVTARPNDQSFNFAAKMNRLWRLADTEHIILMNDDIVVKAPDWLESLLVYSRQDDVGGVGARLLYPDGRIQHAGMFCGIYGVAAHPWYLLDQDAKTYLDWALLPRDCSAVTGAVFATKRHVLERINGYDERFSIDFNDVDMCLRMRMCGLRIVYTPYAEMIHVEKASRGSTFAPASEILLFLRRWRDVMREDPAYSPQLTIDTENVAVLDKASEWLARRTG